MSRFERDLFPWIGAKAIADLTAPEVLSALRKIEERGAIETSHRALSNCGQVFRYAIATGRAARDICADLKGALPPVATKHFAAVTEPAVVTEPKKVGELLRAINGYTGSQIQSPPARAIRLKHQVQAATICKFCGFIGWLGVSYCGVGKGHDGNSISL